MLGAVEVSDPWPEYAMVEAWGVLIWVEVSIDIQSIAIATVQSGMEVS